MNDALIVGARSKGEVVFQLQKEISFKAYQFYRLAFPHHIL